ncbi:MAG: lipoprotein insertase outer membrane protein LolB [Lysobacterales bacterium]
MRILGWVFATLLLTGCAAMPWNWGGQAVRGRYPGNAENRLLTRFALSGRLAIATGTESGSGRIDWEQNLDHYSIRLRSPVSGQSWRLSGDDSGASLEGLRTLPLRGPSAEALLKRELGWDLPVAALRQWVQGRSTDPGSRIERDAEGWPMAFDEAGWHIEYRDWHTGFEPPLPARIEARRGDARVRLAIASWQIERVEVGGGG